MKYSGFLCISVLAASMVMATISNAHAWERRHSGSFKTGSGHSGTYNGESSGKKGQGYKTHQNITTSKGKSLDRDAEGKCTKDAATGVISCGKSTTGFGGHKRTSKGQYDKETGEYSGSATGENGKGVSVQGTGSHGQNDGTYTTEGGGSGSYHSEMTHDGDTVSKDRSITNDEGVTIDSTTSYDGDTNTLDHSVTGPNGKTHSGSVTFEPND